MISHPWMHGLTPFLYKSQFCHMAHESCKSEHCLASFPGLSTIQFLIACSIQNVGERPGPFYHMNDVSHMQVWQKTRNHNAIQDSMHAADSWRRITCHDLVRWKGTAIQVPFHLMATANKNPSKWQFSFNSILTVMTAWQMKNDRNYCTIVLQWANPTWSPISLASYPGPFEKSEKRAWYPLFAHALN